MRRIASAVRAHYAADLLALGVYGSLARGTDGPFSDIEMHCVLRGDGIETCYEWSNGPLKAEVDVNSAYVLLRWAAQVEGEWPITHGGVVNVEALYDPDAFFPRLRAAALDHSDQAFELAMRELIIGTIYELVGKLRNANAAGNRVVLPYYTLELARAGACLVGLANHHLFTTTSCMWDESLTLPGAPPGYAELAQLVMSGRLARSQPIMRAVNAFWEGIEQWAEGRGMGLVDTLEDLLKN